MVFEVLLQRNDDVKELACVWNMTRIDAVFSRHIKHLETQLTPTLSNVLLFLNFRTVNK
jgi:hypothetical protein